jgi:hypothetical protein
MEHLAAREEQQGNAREEALGCARVVARWRLLQEWIWLYE